MCEKNLRNHFSSSFFLKKKALAHHLAVSNSTGVNGIFFEMATLMTYNKTINKNINFIS